MKPNRKPSLSAIMVSIIAVVLFVNVFDSGRYHTPEKVIEWDVINFYSYLPAVFAEGDISLSFAKEDPDRYISSNHYWPETLPNGDLLIKTTMGLSMLYCPFFLVAHAVAEPLGYEADGFSQPYALALILAGGQIVEYLVVRALHGGGSFAGCPRCA